jgi:hypothetical protein
VLWGKVLDRDNTAHVYDTFSEQEEIERLNQKLQANGRPTLTGWASKRD